MDYHSPPKPDTTAAEPARWDSSEHDTNPDYVYQENKRDYKHSGPGIASFVIALLTLVCYAIIFVYVGAQAASLMNENKMLIAGSAETIMYLGLSMLILVAVNVIGAVTGIIGLTLRRRRKVFAVIGTIVNAAFLLLFMLLLSVVLVNAGAS
ncbi:hypothetical protein MHH28_31930 [Paenibacillus sp. FSL K6-1217]|uniref:hypothetical protein n=1 Tax=Paenibacillus sp. FSL K6-1217 TaxID=2921466 RepID=UPI00324686CA